MIRKQEPSGAAAVVQEMATFRPAPACLLISPVRFNFVKSENAFTRDTRCRSSSERNAL